MKASKPCVKEGCNYPKFRQLQRCVWHWLLAQPIEKQIEYADARLASATGEHRARVDRSEWPHNERWCSGCQSFVPQWFCTGSRCKADASRASQAGRLEATYSVMEDGALRPMTRDDYEALLALQEGRCYVCRRRAGARRLAVDHDHASGAVRGLLCPDNERGCNAAILGNLEASSVDGGLAAAGRMLDYLKNPPAARLWIPDGLPDWAR